MQLIFYMNDAMRIELALIKGALLKEKARAKQSRAGGDKTRAGALFTKSSKAKDESINLPTCNNLSTKYRKKLFVAGHHIFLTHIVRVRDIVPSFFHNGQETDRCKRSCWC